ncbi:hypothetical protein ACQ4LE_001852 [Meloidogyne hapla]
MAIFTQLTSILLIISMAFIAINEGMNTGNRIGSSGASGCTTYKGKIEHMPETAKNIVWKSSTNGPKKLVLAKGMTGLEKVTLIIGDKQCFASFSNPGLCQVDGESHDGQLIFELTKAKVFVDFQSAQIFSGNMCKIEIEGYNKDAFEAKIKINGADFIIKPVSAPTPMACKRV